MKNGILPTRISLYDHVNECLEMITGGMLLLL